MFTISPRSADTPLDFLIDYSIKVDIIAQLRLLRFFGFVHFSDPMRFLSYCVDITKYPPHTYHDHNSIRTVVIEVLWLKKVTLCVTSMQTVLNPVKKLYWPCMCIFNYFLLK